MQQNDFKHRTFNGDTHEVFAECEKIFLIIFSIFWYLVWVY